MKTLPILALGLLLVPAAVSDSARQALSEELAVELSRVGERIVYETFREDNWELYSPAVPTAPTPVNLTETPDFNELSPHVSPDGTKICFSGG